MSAAPSDLQGDKGAGRRRTLYVQIVIDVESVLLAHPPSSGKAPTKVPYDPSQFIVTTTQGVAVNSKGVIALHASAGETVRVYALSGSNNFDDAALMSAIGSRADGAILEDFALVELSAETAVPVLGAQPPSETSAEEDFWFWQSRVTAKGIEPYKLVLALYDRDETTGQPHFAGLYQWNLRIRVLGDATSTTGQNEEEETS
jgi:hypothetical protein